MTDFLIYLLVDPRNNLPKYVGLSRQGMKRPKSHTLYCMYNNKKYLRSPLYSWIRKLIKLNLKPIIKVLEDNIENIDILCEREIYFIAEYRKKYKMLNIANGGRINNKSEAGMKRLREKNIGKKHSEETKEKIRQIRLGTKAKPEIIEKKRLQMIGVPRSEETKKRISETRLAKNIKHSPETRLKLLELGKLRQGLKSPHSKDTIRKTSLTKNIKNVENYIFNQKKLTRHFFPNLKKYEIEEDILKFLTSLNNLDEKQKERLDYIVKKINQKEKAAKQNR